ncbi:predicted protein [Sclerotinia sclerotiorum 1980 UF-70]|uniref:Uncharacterized protein n=1 Tax=Sclerotinia sclerotiorum (strain ATCC 18683 / 1980 / Ss-1) TaxID=665079 RepID=A7EAH1_SCLS1|nr:predicted protein [Sclerotinia sclerotiorum 1980 UF-70]EDN99449.1 predicted protein [Sclerotinia sclerotiorum 1980 UF-70]
MSTDRQDFQIWTISTSDYDRKIEFRGELILVYNEITKDTPVDKYKVSIKEEFTIPKGYKLLPKSDATLEEWLIGFI